MPKEMDTTPLLEEAWAKGKTVLFPVCSETVPGKMRFAPCSCPEELHPGKFGIPEPVAPHAKEEATPDLFIVPGVAFDVTGLRLGMGGGYYDRLLALPCHADAVRVGFAYSFQIVNSLPKDAWDVPVHAVCTDQGIVWIQHSPPFLKT